MLFRYTIGGSAAPSLTSTGLEARRHTCLLHEADKSRPPRKGASASMALRCCYRLQNTHRLGGSRWSWQRIAPLLRSRDPRPFRLSGNRGPAETARPTDIRCSRSEALSIVCDVTKVIGGCILTLETGLIAQAEVVVQYVLGPARNCALPSQTMTSPGLLHPPRQTNPNVSAPPKIRVAAGGGGE